MTAYEKFTALDADFAPLSLERCADEYCCFCRPVGACPIGFEGAIMYCFIDGCGEAVFACNPESCAERYVYPLAASFDDFIALVLACGGANPAEQAVWMDKSQFEQHLREEREAQAAEQQRLLALLQAELGIAPMESPFEYVKALQAEFDYGKIEFGDEYYDVLGIEK